MAASEVSTSRQACGSSSSAGSEPYDRHALRLLFNACDPHNTGAITKANLLDGCRRLELDDLTESDADALFAELDVDGGGHVTFDAFAERFIVWSRQAADRGEGEDSVQREEDSPRDTKVSTSEQTHPFTERDTEEARRVKALLDRYRVDPSCELLESLLRDEWRWPGARIQHLLKSLSPQRRHSDDELAILFRNAVAMECSEPVTKSLADPGAAARPRLADGATATAKRLSPYHSSPSGEEVRRHSADAAYRSQPGKQQQKDAAGAALQQQHRRRASDLNSGTESDLDGCFPALKGHDDLLLLWNKLRLSRPELLDPFSSFLDTVSQQLQDAEVQRDRMRTDLQKETRDLDRRAQELDEEAAMQIETERYNIRMQEEDRLRRLRDEMIREVEEREMKLDLALRHVNGLQSKVEQLSQKEKQMESRCEELQQVKSTLETELQFQHIRQEELKAQIESSGHDSPSMSSRLSESDNEVLQKQLEHLRLMNNDLKRELQDRVDELVATEQSKRHGKMADGTQASKDKWYESEEDWSTPFKGKSLHSTSKRSLRGKAAMYTSDDDTDASPMRVAPGRRHRARGIEIGHHHHLKVQPRQLQSPVPRAMDRFLRRKSTAADSDVDSDEGGGPSTVFAARRLDTSLVQEVGEPDSGAPQVSSTGRKSLTKESIDGPASVAGPGSTRSSPELVFREQSPAAQVPLSVSWSHPSDDHLAMGSRVYSDLSPADHDGNVSVNSVNSMPSAGTPPSTAAAVPVLSRSTSALFAFSGQPTAHLSEPESGNSKRLNRHASLQHKTHLYDGKTMHSDGDYARTATSRRIDHSAPAGKHGAVALPSPDAFASPVLAQRDPLSSRRYPDVAPADKVPMHASWPTGHAGGSSGGGGDGGKHQASFHSSHPNVKYGLSPGMRRRRYSPAGGDLATAKSVPWYTDADDVVSLRSFVIEEQHESGSGPDQSLSSARAYPGEADVAARAGQPFPAANSVAAGETQHFKRTASLQPRGSGGDSSHVRGRKKRKKFEESRVRELPAAEQRQRRQQATLPDMNSPGFEVFAKTETGFPAAGPVSLPAARSHLRSSSSDDPHGSLDSQADEPAAAALTRGGAWRSSLGNLSLMELTAEELAAPGKPEAMPVVVHPIQATTPQYHTRQRPVSPSIARHVGIMPERVFKVILCGDAGVGKTSYIWRLCNTSADYAGEFKSTLGVDYKMKVLEVDGHITVLQLWDTAGQERFRTFTKQYFRKADGVICVYDITNHKSFVQLKNWLHEVEDATDGAVALMILGNKYDTADVGSRPKRQVTYWQGQQQAQRAGALFAEVSAKTGHGVLETCMELAKLLYSAEEEVITDLLTLSPGGPQSNKKKEKSCCS